MGQRKSRKWDEPFLIPLFTQEEVELIKSIPLCDSVFDDELIWAFNQSGLYSIKSGYWLARKQAVATVKKRRET